MALHDGYFGCGTGAGHSNRRLLELLNELLPPHVELVVLPVRLAKDSPQHDAAWHHGVESALGRSGRTVRVVPVDNGTQGQQRFGGLTAFADLTVAAVGEIRQARAQFRRGLVMLLDVPFFAAAAELESRPGWRTLVLPRSSAALHCPHLRRRVAWERSCLHRVARSGAVVGAISVAMRRHLTEDLGIAPTAVVDMVNGLTERDRDFAPGGDGGLLPAVAADGFWLAFGRAVPRKGFMDLLHALALLRERGQQHPHLVLAAVSETDEPTEHQRALAAFVREHQLPVTLIGRFSAGVRGLLAHPGLRAVVVPSRIEPFGRIPLEAYAAGASPVVATTAGGLAELVTDGVTGFTAASADPASLADALTRAAAVDDRGRIRMRSAGLELLARYDYRCNVATALRHLAPWAVPARPSLPASALGRAGLSVLQVPEECGWNPYVGAAEEALRAEGVEVLRPGLCRDNPEATPPLDIVDLAQMHRPDVVHLHWPEKLARQYGETAALRLLARWQESGTRIVQTVHNLAPHENAHDADRFVHRVDVLIDGAHFFSPAHETAARARRPHLPQTALHLPHPLTPAPALEPARPLTVGCFGRLRDYKRTLDFVRAFLDQAPETARLLVAGAADNTKTHAALTALAAADPRLEYRPGFIDDHTAWLRLLGEVEWVALPYQVLHSSGVLVAALQAGRRILSPTPIGGTGLYVRDARRWWITVDPWDDHTAVAAWARAAVLAPDTAPPALTLPTWPQAAAALADFYARLTRPAAAPAATAAPARVGIL
ncbi:glycosyltransferase [Streptomyces triculaminicus]|uniref:glycosyltransferase family 4 protein n=1 Tax=Streptomyces triculaminicus TaxID=2816232 RepID=UPI0033D487A8